MRNVPLFAHRLDAPLELGNHGTLRVDTAYGGVGFVLVRARDLGLEVRPDEVRTLIGLGMEIIAAADGQIGFSHPENPEWDHFSFCLFAALVEGAQGGRTGRNAVAIRPRKVDRSPTGTGLSARMAVIHARGEMRVGDSFTAESVIGSRFVGKIVGETESGTAG